MNNIFNDVNTLVFDLDGTLADLYGVDDWRGHLNKRSVTPYVEAKPLVDMKELRELLTELKRNGIRVIVTSWLAQNTDREYDAAVSAAKQAWLRKYEVPYDHLYIVKYGTEKSSCSRQFGSNQILIDDNADVRKKWELGPTLDEREFMRVLREVLAMKRHCYDKAS